ncbi:MAG: HAMP domain-containing sensor histidine kinase [Acidimicrobiia bacterium]|nr:HAMP domain-containing sensor histidine kinase [Acidimicrobiia bacterium]
MSTNAEKRSNLPRWATGATAIVALVAVSALVFSNARISSANLEEATALHAADMTLAAQDVALKSLGQVALLAQDLETGVAARETVDAAVAEAERAMIEFRKRSANLDETVAGNLAATLDAFDEAATATITLAADGDGAGASAQLVDSAVPAAEALAADLIVERDARALAVDDAQRRVGRFAQVAGFLAAFLLPVAAMVAYRRSVRRQLEAAETHLEARLESEKAIGRAKDQFIANISHELRTPLTSIYGFSEVLLDQGFVDPNTAEDLVSLINSESAELARMVEDLLVAAHDGASPLAIEATEVSIGDEIEAVIGPFRRRDIAIGGNYADATVWGDQLRIRQILRNLLANAVQHGGPTIRVYGDVAGSSYVVSVEDDGEGVPEHLESRLFTRFVHQGETPLTAGSIGLGLAVARLLADAMDGSLEYEHITGRTSFVLRLPLVGIVEPEMRSDEALVPTTQ